jgi:hypothetical protein
VGQFYAPILAPGGSVLRAHFQTPGFVTFRAWTSFERFSLMEFRLPTMAYPHSHR